jgi:hypothetical protein
LHRHHREDEHSYVLTGTFGALPGDDVVTGEPGTWVFKPRGQWHTFSNAGDIPCEIIEVISPGAFEEYFRELRAIWPDRIKATLLRQKYELDMDSDSVAGLCALWFDLMGAFRWATPDAAAIESRQNRVKP